MTFESRAKHAAAAIHGAVALVEPRVPVRRRRRGWRAFIIVTVTALTPPSGAVVWNSLSEDPAPAKLVIDLPQQAEERGHDDPTAAPPAVLPAAGADTTVDISTAPSGHPTAQQSGSATSLPATDKFSRANCDPVLLDAQGDIDDPALDIVTASVTYDAPTRTLKIGQVFTDLPESHLPREALAYFFSFDVDGMTYHAMSYIGAASYMQWQFAVQRDDRTVDQWPEGRRTLLYASGEADHLTDTVTLEFNIDDFNVGERAVAAEEGLAPAAELRPGSMLTSIRMTAYARSAGPGAQDYASGCDFLVEDA